MRLKEFGPYDDPNDNYPAKGSRRDWDAPQQAAIKFYNEEAMSLATSDGYYADSPWVMDELVLPIGEVAEFIETMEYHGWTAPGDYEITVEE